jgi:hypothetical protein
MEDKPCMIVENILEQMNSVDIANKTLYFAEL